MNIAYTQRAKRRLAARNVAIFSTRRHEPLDVSIGFSVSREPQVRIFGKNLLNDRDLEFPPISFTHRLPTSVGVELRTAF